MKIHLVRKSGPAFQMKVYKGTTANEIQALLRNKIIISGNRPCQGQLLQKGDVVCLLPRKR